MSKFKRINLSLKQQSLDKLLREYLSGHAPTRSSVASSCGLCTVTSGKVADALISSGFMDGRIFSKNDERPATHLLFNDSSSVLIIDLASSIYKMCVVNPSGKTLLTLSHVYDSEVPFEDNLNIFISRNGLKLKRSKTPFAAIAVLYADDYRRERLESNSRVCSLPSISIKDYVDEIIYTILGRKVTSHLTLSSSVRYAMDFKVIEMGLYNGGISSVFIGSRLSSFHVHKNGSVMLCSPENILSKEELSYIDNIRLISKEKQDALFVRLADFMDAAFSPEVVLLSSDIIPPDSETAEIICRKFALTNRRAPVIYTRDSSFPLEYLGASRHALLSVIKVFINTNNR